ncbi:MAG: peptidyl-prolyl cis-trans isomerase [Acidobacteriota bacterium]|jgi:cyclophilin family peptidyl-prolyl cis-trans isomerase|nr:peptidyl-prolyl cis-trans isomerase [Acidobacteriota bacterium]
MSQKVWGRRAALLVLALTLTAASCGKNDNKLATKDSDAEGDVNEANVKKGAKPEADAQAAVIETDYGRIVIELYPNLAPKMVERFKQLAGEGFYNGTTIHRIDPALGIIQGGDPNSKDSDPANDGAGNSPLPNVPAEFSDIQYDRGIVGAARGQSNDSANCQFFITLKRQPAFDKRYTVFGRVIEGMSNADIISTAPVAEGSERPADRVLVKSVTLAPRSNFK